MTDVASGLTVRNPQEDNREMLLASMRLAVLNLRSWQAELEMIGTAVKSGLMTTDTACDWLDEAGLLCWLPPPQQIEGEQVSA